MTQVEFLAGGNSIDQAIDFICDLVGEFFISEKKEILSDSRIHIRCESILNANKVNDKINYYVSSITEKKNVPNFLIEKDNDSVDIKNLLKGLKLVSDYLEKSIFKPNNINYPSSRSDFVNLLK